MESPLPPKETNEAKTTAHDTGEAFRSRLIAAAQHRHATLTKTAQALDTTPNTTPLKSAEDETKAAEHYKNTSVVYKKAQVAIEMYQSKEFITLMQQTIPADATFLEGAEKVGQYNDKMATSEKQKEQLLALKDATTFATMLGILKEYDTSQNLFLTRWSASLFSTVGSYLSEQTRKETEIYSLLVALRNDIAEYAHKKGYSLEFPKLADSKDDDEDNDNFFRP